MSKASFTGKMSAYVDLTGQRFGKLTVLRRAEHNASYGKPLWICLCDCGRATTVRTSNLKRGITQSCGCLRALHGASTLIDLTGQRFGKLTVLGRAKKNGSDGAVRWVCRCDCGRKTVIRGSNLKRQQACGSCFKEHNWKLIDLTGRQFGRLTVIGRAKRKGRQRGTRWRCRCACGRHTIANSADLLGNRHRSCGCAGAGPQSLIDLTGQRFGKLTVLGRSLSKPAYRTRAYWNCRCDCGRLAVAWGTDLRRHKKVSCGRCRDRNRLGQFAKCSNGDSCAEPRSPAETAQPARRPRGRPKNAIDPVARRRHKEIVEAWKTGQYETVADLARAHHVHRTTASKILKDAGITS